MMRMRRLRLLLLQVRSKTGPTPKEKCERVGKSGGKESQRVRKRIPAAEYIYTKTGQCFLLPFSISYLLSTF